MIRKLKKIIQKYGMEALYYPEDLAKVMRESGISEKNVHGVMLILKCCPITADLLCQEQMSEVEAHSLLASVVRNTGLSIGTARHILGALLMACGVRTTWIHIPALTDMLVGRDVKPEDSTERKVSALVKSLENNGETPELIAALDDLARSGCARAAYTLGMHYRKSDLHNGTDDAIAYFQMAAKAGFGPANGALAEYEINRDRKRLWKAAKYFHSPTTLSGAEGREWVPLSKKLLKYRQENEGRLRGTLIVQAVVFVLSLALIHVLAIEPSFWRTAAVGIQALSFGWSLICRLFSPYHTTATAVGLMTLSWLILILAGI